MRLRPVETDCGDCVPRLASRSLSLDGRGWPEGPGEGEASWADSPSPCPLPSRERGEETDSSRAVHGKAASRPPHSKGLATDDDARAEKSAFRIPHSAILAFRNPQSAIGQFISPSPGNFRAPLRLYLYRLCALFIRNLERFSEVRSSEVFGGLSVKNFLESWSKCETLVRFALTKV
jgi:hypothetical protein